MPDWQSWLPAMILFRNCGPCILSIGICGISVGPLWTCSPHPATHRSIWPRCSLSIWLMLVSAILQRCRVDQWLWLPHPVCLSGWVWICSSLRRVWGYWLHWWCYRHGYALAMLCPKSVFCVVLVWVSASWSSALHSHLFAILLVLPCWSI